MATLGGYLNSETPLLELYRPRQLANIHQEKVLIVTADSRILVGTMAACDQTTNLVWALHLSPPRKHELTVYE